MKIRIDQTCVYLLIQRQSMGVRPTEADRLWAEAREIYQASRVGS